MFCLWYENITEQKIYLALKPGSFKQPKTQSLNM